MVTEDLLVQGMVQRMLGWIEGIAHILFFLGKDMDEWVCGEKSRLETLIEGLSFMWIIILCQDEFSSILSTNMNGLFP